MLIWWHHTWTSTSNPFIYCVLRIFVCKADLLTLLFTLFKKSESEIQKYLLYLLYLFRMCSMWQSGYLLVDDLRVLWCFCKALPSSCHILLDHPPLSQHWHHHLSYFPIPLAGNSWWRHTWMFPNALILVLRQPKYWGKCSLKAIIDGFLVWIFFQIKNRQ